MSFNTFTVTQVTYDFTATITTPLSLAVQTTTTSVLITGTTATVVVTNQIAPITVNGTQQFNQSLNTFDNVSFATVTANAYYGYAGQPPLFVNGINILYPAQIDFVNPNDP